MIITNKNKDTENHISVKIENFSKSSLIKNFKENDSIKNVIDFLNNLDFDLRSSSSISVFSAEKILIFRS